MELTQPHRMDNRTEKTVICEENIYQLNLVRRFKKWPDLSLMRTVDKQPTFNSIFTFKGNK